MDYNCDTPISQSRTSSHRGAIVYNWAFWRALTPNFHEVSEGFYRSAQLTPGKLKTCISRYGIKTVVNLRGVRSNCRLLALEEEVCKKLGVKLIHMRLLSREYPHVSHIAELHELITNNTEPILMHCKGGADRAGLVSTLYQHWVLNIPLEETDQLKLFPYQHFAVGRTGLIDDFFSSYLKYNNNAEHPISLLEWSQTVMDRKKLMSEFRTKPFGNFIVDHILRRE